MREADCTNEVLWDDYSNKFNSLSDKMVSAGIDTNELLDLIIAYENLPNTLQKQIQHGIKFKTGFTT
jgi:hypothetical protein